MHRCPAHSTLVLLTTWVCFSPPALEAQHLSPPEAVKRMRLPDSLAVQAVAHEPLITQPVCIEFDDRGRLWVVQYIQYPNPAGLKRAQVDRWSRTTYDVVPQPPPFGPKGADRITILEDADNDGVADSGHDFLNGLNLATGLAFGHGGVFVLNVPYLLFYPDRNRDDVPDANPEVCLTGFGMEDAHSVANSLTWGPDGWLYGCQGSTVTSHIRGIEFQQGVWRYHPLTREFELFCEGGGNAWGLDFDEEGELIASTNLGPYRHLHAVQGAYYWKSFGKHGSLHNPYAFGYFDHIAHTNFTGGHVTDGGLIYRGTNLPPQFRQKYICGDLLGHGVQWHDMFREGSSFTSAHGGYLLAANDPWFAPTDVTISPDGAVYVADWHDQRTAHPDPDAEWDRSNGRVYRISRPSIQPLRPPEFSRLPTPQLLELLSTDNPWVARQSLRALADRRDPEAILPLRTALAAASPGTLALRQLWALHLSGGFNATVAAQTLRHPEPAVRRWSIRLLGDDRRVSEATGRQLALLARSESDVRVRAQLASSAQRLPTTTALPILQGLLQHAEDAKDLHQPLLIWWAIEAHAIEGIPTLVQWLTAASTRESELLNNIVKPRLARRWAAEGTKPAFEACAAVLAATVEPAAAAAFLRSIDQGFDDRRSSAVGFGSGGLFASASRPELRRPGGAFARERLSPQLEAVLLSRWREDTRDPVLIRLRARAGHPEAAERARALVQDPSAPASLRQEMLGLLGRIQEERDASLLLQVSRSGQEPVQHAALEALANFSTSGVPRELLANYSNGSVRQRGKVRELLLLRRDWTLELLQAVDHGKLPASEIPVEQLRLVALHEDGGLNALVKKHWGNISRGTDEERLAEMRRLNNDLNAGPGDPANGRVLFQKTCASCHKLNELGSQIGPDLTHANRGDREFLLASLVDPSAVIRKEHLAFEVEVDDGRRLTGVILDQSDGQIRLGIISGDRVTIPQTRVVSLRESTVSLMPEGLLAALRPQEVRDLFAFLQLSR